MKMNAFTNFVYAALFTVSFTAFRTTSLKAEQVVIDSPKKSFKG